MNQYPQQLPNPLGKRRVDPVVHPLPGTPVHYQASLAQEREFAQDPWLRQLQGRRQIADAQLVRYREQHHDAQ